MKNLQKLAYTYHFKIIHKKAMGTFIYNSMKCLLVACGTLVDSNNTCTVWKLCNNHTVPHTHACEHHAADNTQVIQSLVLCHN